LKGYTRLLEVSRLSGSHSNRAKSWEIATARRLLRKRKIL